MLCLPIGRTTALALLTFAIASRISAQETPTQREAAKDVIAKMETLERSLKVAELVTRLSGPNAARDQVAARAKELMDTELLALSDDITRHPEHGFVEYESVRKLTDYLKTHGFTVTNGVAGLPTAFVARYEPEWRELEAWLGRNRVDTHLASDPARSP